MDAASAGSVRHRTRWADQIRLGQRRLHASRRTFRSAPGNPLTENKRTRRVSAPLPDQNLPKLDLALPRLVVAATVDARALASHRAQVSRQCAAVVNTVRL